MQIVIHSLVLLGAELLIQELVYHIRPAFEDSLMVAVSLSQNVFTKYFPC